MFRNYFRIVVKSLVRNPFFTVVSLVGIGFSLMLMVLLASVFESSLGNMKPMTKKDQMVLCNRAALRIYAYDTIQQFDTVSSSGILRIDTSTQYFKTKKGGWEEGVGYFLLDKYYRDVPGVTDYSFFQERIQRDVFINDKKLTFSSNHSDASYWNVFDFTFLEGKPFSEQDVDLSANVCVITTRASRLIFGSELGNIGKEFRTNGKQYKVVGVVEPVNTFVSFVNNDLFFPLSQLDQATLNSRDYIGSFKSVFMARSPRNRKQVIAEINSRTAAIPIPVDLQHYNELLLFAADFDAAVADGMMPVSDDPNSTWLIMRSIVIFFLLLFITVPTINLINLNVSRIMERASEIGVRKAFGATSGMIAKQLLFENIILTVVGGFVGCLAALVAIWIINQVSGTLLTLRFNGMVFIYGLTMTFLFGLVSGLLPALRSSKIHVVDALKNTRL